MPSRKSNSNLKERRARSWRNGQEAKTLRKAVQEQATARNRKAGISPWQVAKVKRAATRAQNPDVQRRVRNSRQANRDTE